MTRAGIVSVTYADIVASCLTVSLVRRFLFLPAAHPVLLFVARSLWFGVGQVEGKGTLIE